MFREPTRREEAQIQATADLISELGQVRAELKHEQAQAEIMRNALAEIVRNCKPYRTCDNMAGRISEIAESAAIACFRV